MTNFDPGGLLVLLTVMAAVLVSVVSIGVAHLAARLGYGDYETNVVVMVALLLLGWIGAALVVSTQMVRVLAMTLSMVGAYAVTRSVRATSYGWILGVVLLFATFVVLSSLGIYRGVGRSGRPRGFLSRHFVPLYYGGLFLCGALGGVAVQVLGRQYGRWSTAVEDASGS